MLQIKTYTNYDKDLLNQVTNQIKLILQKKEADKARSITEKQYRDLFDNSLMGIYRTTLDGDMIVANQALLNMFGYNSVEELSKKLKKGKVYIGDKFTRHDFLKRFKGNRNKVVGLEYSVARSDGSILFIRENSKAVKNSRNEILYFEGTVEDITESKIAAQKIIESESNYKQVVENAIDIIFSTDNRGNFVFANRAAIKFSGFTKKELFQKNYRDLIRKDYKNKVARFYYEQLSKKKNRTYLEFPLLNKDGQIKWLAQNSRLIVENKSIKGMHIIARDITENKKSELIRSTIEKISHTTNISSNLTKLFASIHNSIKDILVADNFYIALHDKELNRIEFPYFQDEINEFPNTRKYSNGFTEFIIENKVPQLLDNKKIIEIAKTYDLNKPKANLSQYYLGCPLKIGNEIHGVFAVQIYNKIDKYTNNDKQLFSVISQNISLAIERKRKEDALIASEKRFRNLFMNSPIGIYRMTKDGTVLNSNPAFVENDWHQKC